MINHYKQTSTKKQNQNQIGTTATTSNTQEAERCETRISQPSHNTKQGSSTSFNMVYIYATYTL